MQRALTNFSQSLDRIRDIATDIRANAPSALAHSRVRARHETVQYASVVVLSGYLESFIRELAEAYVGKIELLNIAFANLPDKMRFAYFEEGGRVLQEAAKVAFTSWSSWVAAPPDDVALRIASPHSGITPHVLLWEAFAQTKANPGPDTIKAFLERCGIEKVGEKLATEMKSHGHDFVVELKSFMKVRNECAHNGVASVALAPSSLEQYCDLLQRTGESMVAILEARLLHPPFGVTVTPASPAGVGTPPPGTAAVGTTGVPSRVGSALQSTAAVAVSGAASPGPPVATVGGAVPSAGPPSGPGGGSST